MSDEPTYANELDAVVSQSLVAMKLASEPSFNDKMSQAISAVAQGATLPAGMVQVPPNVNKEGNRKQRRAKAKSKPRLSVDYETVLRAELKLIQRELVDGCNDCNNVYDMCTKHRKFIGNVVSSPAKYVELKNANGKVTSKRLFDIEKI